MTSSGCKEASASKEYYHKLLPLDAPGHDICPESEKVPCQFNADPVVDAGLLESPSKVTQDIIGQ
jgi:hypothetical protein